MQLVNSTAVPARVAMARLPGGDRGGILTAKATFRIEGSGVELDTQAPYPVSRDPIATELGPLPDDEAIFACDRRFEVAVLGRAHAPGAAPVAELRVGLQIGKVRRELLVFGDRTWIAAPGGAQISEPAPFTSMPLTWEHAFGGSCEIEIDEGAFIQATHPVNPAGRGLDVETLARRHAEAWKCPAGFPRYRYTRLLPNLEGADERIVSPNDAPRPRCWAPLPGMFPWRDTAGASDRTWDPHDPSDIVDAWRSAAPEWVIDRPPAGAEVVMEGLSPAGSMRFGLPALRVFADYQLGARAGSLALRPQLVCLLPEEGRLVMVYYAIFRTPYVPGEERALRLRLEHGWEAPIT